jgi:hypothetical protein
MTNSYIAQRRQQFAAEVADLKAAHVKDEKK